MKFLLLALFLVSCTTKVSPPTATSISTDTSILVGASCPPGQYAKSIDVNGKLTCEGKICPPTPAGCPPAGIYPAVDISGPVSVKLLDTLKCAGVHTIIRYYDWPGQESLKGKIPLAAEITLIKNNGFKILFVFQHFNSAFSTFQSKTRPDQDVAAILKLAKQFGQPKGTGIYVGVDGDFSTKDQLAAVRGYFGKLSPKLREAGFKVGMYGGGANCVSLQGAKLIDLPCWIAASSWGWDGTTPALTAGNYGLKQKVNQKCEGLSLDYNAVNPKYVDFGQWSIP